MLEIKISADSTLLTQTREDGTKETKPVDLSDLISSLSSNVVHDFGLMSRGIRYLVQKGPNLFAVIEVPANTYDLQYDGDVHQGVSLPTALFFFSLFKKTDGRFSIGDTQIFALKTPFVNLMTDPLYHYPSPNIWREDHKICWGNSLRGIPSIKSPAALTSLAQRYFAAPFNNDLFSSNYVSNEFPWKETNSKLPLVGRYFQYLTENPFDPSWLKPAISQYSNFDKAVKHFRP